MNELGDLIERIERLEAHTSIRSLMARYFQLCEQLEPGIDLSELGELFAADAVWRGKGSRYAKAFGEHTGRNAIVAMIRAHSDPPHFAMNAHFLSGESIEVLSDGETAVGHWMMLQTSSYADNTADLRSARLTVEFSKTGGTWRIQTLETENIFNRAIDRWDTSDHVPIPDSVHGEYEDG